MNRSLYTRPNKPRYVSSGDQVEVPVLAPSALPELIEVDRFTECHVTPLDVADRMVEYLGPTRDMLTLEPSAGTGNLIQALYDSGHSRFELTAIERHYGLCKTIQKRFKDNQYIDPIQQCFLEYADEAKGKIEFPRIIMNPPFRDVRKHMKAALSLLGFGGHELCTLIALVPSTYQHDDMETLETLNNETFSSAKVNTKIINIEYYR